MSTRDEISRLERFNGSILFHQKTGINKTAKLDINAHGQIIGLRIHEVVLESGHQEIVRNLMRISSKLQFRPLNEKVFAEMLRRLDIERPSLEVNVKIVPTASWINCKVKLDVDAVLLEKQLNRCLTELADHVIAGYLSHISRSAVFLTVLHGLLRTGTVRRKLPTLFNHVSVDMD